MHSCDAVSWALGLRLRPETASATRQVLLLESKVLFNGISPELSSTLKTISQPFRRAWAACSGPQRPALAKSANSSMHFPREVRRPRGFSGRTDSGRGGDKSWRSILRKQRSLGKAALA